MTVQQVSRYIDLAHRKIELFMLSGMDKWRPEYNAESQQIEQELKALRPLVDEELKKRGKV